VGARGRRPTDTYRAPDGSYRLAGWQARCITTFINRWEWRRGALGSGGTCRSRAGPSENENVLTLEEPLGSYATGGSTLAGIFAQRGYLHGGNGRTGECFRAACGRDDDILATWIHGREMHHASSVTESDSCHTTGRTTLWTYRIGAEVKKLRIGGDEHQFLSTRGELYSADHRISVIESDH
jgi:hypothetical protein